MVDSKEFKEKKLIIDLKHACDKECHEWKMKELKTVGENDRVRHERDLERQRIKSAEIRKTQMRKGEGFKY